MSRSSGKVWPTTPMTQRSVPWERWPARPSSRRRPITWSTSVAWEWVFITTITTSTSALRAISSAGMGSPRGGRQRALFQVLGAADVDVDDLAGALLGVVVDEDTD